MYMYAYIYTCSNDNKITQHRNNTTALILRIITEYNAHLIWAGRLCVCKLRYIQRLSNTSCTTQHSGVLRLAGRHR